MTGRPEAVDSLKVSNVAVKSSLQAPSTPIFPKKIDSAAPNFRRTTSNMYTREECGAKVAGGARKSIGIFSPSCTKRWAANQDNNDAS